MGVIVLLLIHLVVLPFVGHYFFSGRLNQLIFAYKLLTLYFGNANEIIAHYDVMLIVHMYH